MNAVTIIDNLTRNYYTNQNGVFTLDSDDKVPERLHEFFGDNLETIYDPNKIFGLWVEKERNFLYMYNERLDSENDKDIFAILYADESDILYLYEID